MNAEQSREQFEAAVIARMKESGYLEVEIRVECLQRDSKGDYFDGSIDAYWHFWQASRAVLEVELPKPEWPEASEMGSEEPSYDELRAAAQFVIINKCQRALETAGIPVKP